MSKLSHEQTAVAASEAAVTRNAIERIAFGLADVFAGMLERRRQRAAVRDLKRLSDYELRDIGINRSDIEWAVAEARNGDPRKAMENARAARSRQRQAALNYAVGDPRRLPLVD